MAYTRFSFLHEAINACASSCNVNYSEFGKRGVGTAREHLLVGLCVCVALGEIACVIGCVASAL